MPRKLTDREKKLIKDVQEKESELDVDFILRIVAHKLVGQPLEDQIGAIVKTLHAISAISRVGAECAANEAVDREGITVDEAVDIIKQFVETSAVLTAMGDLINEALHDEEEGPLGLFSISRDKSNQFMEEMRMSLVRDRSRVRRNAKQ